MREGRPQGRAFVVVAGQQVGRLAQTRDAPRQDCVFIGTAGVRQVAGQQVDVRRWRKRHQFGDGQVEEAVGIDAAVGQRAGGTQVQVGELADDHASGLG